ncbi:unnamed protein product [Lampetra fluviatilis]
MFRLPLPMSAVWVRFLLLSLGPSGILAQPPECPAHVLLALDTSESVALRVMPYGHLVEKSKSFAAKFIETLRNRTYPCDRILTWSVGTLQYSDEVHVISELAALPKHRSQLLSHLATTTYIGRGTNTDCALSTASQQLMLSRDEGQSGQFLVVVTDGHPLDGYQEPCGGLDHAATMAKDQGIKLFAVAISPDHQEQRLSAIVSGPRYRSNFTATSSKESENVKTIEEIVDIIVREADLIHEIRCCSFECEPPRGETGIRGGIGEPGIDGKRGPLGVSGVMGQKGIPGEDGPQGSQGEKGRKGDAGTEGLDGMKGDAGFPGLPGCNGVDGVPGGTGKRGVKGDPGPPGEKGNKGEPGVEGIRGPIGSPGPPGMKGNEGLQGHNGTKGDEGEEGDIGLPGDTGPNGTKGEQWGRGVPGIRGESGDKGEEGPLGPNGHHGLPGSIGQLGQPGIEGVKGFKGEDGPQGDEGPKGLQGPVGDLGQKGPPGDIGENGTAAVGLMGPAGFPGLKGFIGHQGDVGDPGDEGDPGEESGQQGMMGPMGYPGPEGPLLNRGCLSCVRTPIEECKCGPVELVFVLDSSESIGLESFSLSKEFIIHTLNRVVANGNVKPENEGSHITVVQYSHGKMQELVSSNKSSIQSFNDLKREIKSLRWMAGGTFTGEALEVTRRRLSDSALASRAAVVLTDGNSDTLRDPTPLNSLCQLPGMRVSAVGIGSFFKHAWNEEGLKELSCDADGAPGVVLTTNDHAGLVDDDLLARVVDFACRDKKCPDFKCSSFKGPTDLLMLLDGSSRVGHKNFQNTKVAAKHIADLLLSTGNVTRVSVAQYSGSGPEQVDVAFSGEHEVVETGLREIQYSGDPAPVDLAATMSFAQKYLKETVRDETRQQALVFTDGCTEGGEDGNKRLSEQAAEMLKTGMLIFAVAVGEGLSQDGLLRLVSGQNESTVLGSTIRTEDRIITVSGYATLKLDITCRKIARTISTQQPRVGGQE